MRLIDRIVDCHAPLIVQHVGTGALTRLSGPLDHAKEVAQCPTRYVLSDELTRLCTALAYSKGARTLSCADLLHIPAERVWVEWCEAPWQEELRLYGFVPSGNPIDTGGRRGAWIRASRDGRRGSLRTFWGSGDADVLASSMEAHFDFDSTEEGGPELPGQQTEEAIAVSDSSSSDADELRRCFRFCYEQSWSDYYAAADLTPDQKSAIAHHALGTIALDVPVLVAFFLLLGTRTGLPQRHAPLERLNRSRAKAGKRPLLAYVEVLSPLLSPTLSRDGHETASTVRRSPRLHHVRGHIVRRGSQLFWRVPHIRGSAGRGNIRSRTVTWTIERSRG